MKKMMIIGMGLFLLASCHNYKKDAERLEIVRDSLTTEAAIKVSAINDFLSDFNEIQANLDSIKKLEELVTVQSESREISRRQKDRILEDIQLLNEMLQKNKELTASLQKKLNSSNYKIGQLEGTITQLQQMVDNLERQVLEKDAEIVALNNQVQKLNIDISSLNQKIQEIETVSAEKSEVIESQEDLLNKAYFAYGSSKELKENSVIEKEGGILGIGRTSVIPTNFNRDYFTEIDIRTFDYLPLMVKKAELVSVHPADSYHISGDKTADTLFIDNRSQFWKASKYLVIEIN
jgi:myosin heavy subunit